MHSISWYYVYSYILNGGCALAYAGGMLECTHWLCRPLFTRKVTSLHLQRHCVERIHPEWWRFLSGIAVWDGSVFCLGARCDTAVLRCAPSCRAGAAPWTTFQSTTIFAVQNSVKSSSTVTEVRRHHSASNSLLSCLKSFIFFCIAWSHEFVYHFFIFSVWLILYGMVIVTSCFSSASAALMSFWGQKLCVEKVNCDYYLVIFKFLLL